MLDLRSRLQLIDAAVHRFLVARSVALLRVSLGVVFLAFAILKYFPGVSPVEGLARRTTDLLTLGLVPADARIVFVATLECAIGLLLILRRWLRLALYLLALELVGILSPVVLLPGRLFGGPHHAPTLEGQYVLKDVILVAAAMVVASTLRGGRLMAGAQSAKPTPGLDEERAFTAPEKVEIVLAGIRAGESSLDQVCRAHGITEQAFERWREEFLAGALAAMTAADTEIEEPTTTTTSAEPPRG